MSLMVSVSGVRGVEGKDLTPPVVVGYVRSFLRIVGKTGGKILVGRDTRRSGEFIEKLAWSALARGDWR